MTAVAVPDTPVRTTDRAEEVRARAVGALLTCVARHGLAKTTLDDVAGEAGCARATLYRHVGDKRALVEATVCAEIDRITAATVRAAACTDSLADALAAVVATASREVRDHAAFQFLLAYEPETVLPHLSFSGFDRLLATAGPVVAPAFAPYLPHGEAERLAEWAVRVVLDCGGEGSPIDLTDDSAAHRFVTNYLLPSIAPSASSPRG